MSEHQPPPVFPGGWEPAPEVTHGGGCGHAACSCSVEPGRVYCCRACATAGEDADTCACGHFGCAVRA